MKNIFLFFELFLLLISCRPNAIENLSDDDSQLYITSYDDKVNFSEYVTFAPTEEFFYVNGGKVSPSTKEGELYFKDKVIKTLITRGFVQKNVDEKPDLGLHIMLAANTKLGQDSFSALFFNNYWGFPSFGTNGFAYPGIYDSYETRDVIWNIELVDLKNAAKNKQLKVLWNAQIQGKGLFNPEKLAGFVEKLFSKSPYLKTVK